MRLVFMGTPDFAVGCLKEILASTHEVVAVVTTPDKPAGRGKKMHQSAVKAYALEQNIPVLQPEKLRDENFHAELQKFNADIFVVVAFRMLPKVVWDMPKYGTFNLHASLLPQYRGAAPINWTIINGESQTGVTTFFINEDIDTGNIIFRESVTISDTDTAGTLHDKLMLTGANLIVKTLSAVEAGNYEALKQDESIELKPAPKIFKEDTRIDFTKTSAEVYNFIRGMAPYPAATAILVNDEKELNLKIYSAKVAEASNLEPGSISTDNRSFIKVGTKNGAIELQEIQIPGKKRMEIKALLNGFELKQGAFIKQ